MNGKKFAYSQNSTTPNTFIGGVASVMSTPADVASKFRIYPSLGIIPAANIKNFKITGNDIEFYIGLDFCIYDNVYNDSKLTTYFKHTGSYMKYCSYGLSLNSNLEVIDIKSLTEVSGSFLGGTSQNKVKTVYIPNVVKFGDTNLNNQCFTIFGQGFSSPTAIFYVHPSMETINSGGVEGDIAYLISIGRTVRYVTNFTAPNPVTDLAAGTIYNTAIQLNFTPPSSTNSIDYYECYVNGVFNKNVTASGQYVTGLTPSTSYNITLIAVDIFYNKSVVSNSLSVSTANNTLDISTGLVSYYKLDETTGTVANDSYGIEHLTNTGITINQSGKISKSYLSTASNQYLSATGVTAITGNFSINCWCYRTAAPNAGNDVIFEQGDYGAGFGLWINSSSQLGWFINTTYMNYSSLAVLPLNTWAMATVVYNGTNVKLYLDGVLKQTTAFTTNPSSTTTRRMFNRTSNSEAYIGRIDEAAIYNIALTQTEIDLLYNSGNGITL